MNDVDQGKLAKALKSDVPLSVKIMLGLGIIGVVGVTGGALIIAYAGEQPDPLSLFSFIIWYAWMVAFMFRIQNRNMILGSVVGAFLGFVFFVLVGIYAVNRIDDETWAARKLMDKVNADLPKMMDEDMRWDSISVSKDAKVYSLNLTFIGYEASDFEDTSELANHFAENGLPAICADPALKGWLHWGYTIKTTYRGKLGKLIAEYDATASNC